MKLFNLDSPLMQFLTMVGNLMILNIITLLFCLPVITAGDALTAMYYVTIKMAKGEDPYIWKSYWKSFKENFAQSTVIWLLMLAAAFVLVADFRIMKAGMSGTAATALKIVLTVISVVAVMTGLYVLPVQSRFANTIRQTIKNAFLMSVMNFPRTLLIAGIHLLPVLLILISMNTIPIMMFLGISCVAYLSSIQFVKIFKKYEPEEEGVVTGNEEELAPLSFIVEEEKAKQEAIAAAERAEAEKKSE